MHLTLYRCGLIVIVSYKFSMLYHVDVDGSSCYKVWLLGKYAHDIRGHIYYRVRRRNVRAQYIIFLSLSLSLVLVLRTTTTNHWYTLIKLTITIVNSPTQKYLNN